MPLAVLAVAGTVYFGINAITAKTDMSLFSQNIEALASGEDGSGSEVKRSTLSFRCNVAQSANGKNLCKQTVVTCQGLGEGCIPIKCTIHNHDL